MFKNEAVDPSFGVSSSIFIDQMTRSGGFINSLAIDAGQAVSSFASKSEPALNLSADDTAFTFMGYKAPLNTLDVSNSNTASAYDSTNPVVFTTARSVPQVSLATGAVQSTTVDANSGNNGPAAVLANGSDYTARAAAATSSTRSTRWVRQAR